MVIGRDFCRAAVNCLPATGQTTFDHGGARKTDHYPSTGCLPAPRGLPRLRQAHRIPRLLCCLAILSLTGLRQLRHHFQTLTDDVAVVEATIRKLVEDENKTAILVMHSYGGLVGAESVPEELTLNTRKAKGLNGGVMHLFYFAAFVMPLGQSVTKTGEAEHWTAKAIPQSAAVTDTVMKRYAWRYVALTYVVCTADKAVPPPVQEMLAGIAGAVVKRIEVDHLAFLTKPEEVLALIEEVAL
ncbi:hypothetical protein BU23DRAFT_572069 [Bimuria novae-zelandiae CBS 107.79]|uniref:AB hydrolase-1 domain-containing protein n=1 Tax=Bimuria novae-zelandiae CBS 107.79 TaxID=1447943 RepID=A0A6A5UYE6_9PLEO|nr:hypothetical protein BU23DRAFT_572069 [Bimuria novae-zelandiae CBS 107.79]